MNHVLYCANEKYFAYMLTSLFSLLENNKDLPLTIHIIEEHFSKDQKEKLDKLLMNYHNVSLKIYPLDKIKDFLDLYQIPLWRNTEISNARIFAYELIQDTDQLLYLDSDTIIVNSVKSLFQKKTNAPLSASKEIIIPSHMQKLVNTYYNSGVLLFDFNYWENEHCIDKIKEQLKSNKHNLIYPDQDLINIALGDLITLLPYKYNIIPPYYEIYKHPYLSKKIYYQLSQQTFEDIYDSMICPYIYHMLKYITVRPWEQNKIHPFNNIFDQYYKKLYPNIPKEKVNTQLVNLSILPTINCIARAFIPSKVENTIKNKVKEKLHRTEL